MGKTDRDAYAKLTVVKEKMEKARKLDAACRTDYHVLWKFDSSPARRKMSWTLQVPSGRSLHGPCLTVRTYGSPREVESSMIGMRFIRSLNQAERFGRPRPMCLEFRGETTVNSLHSQDSKNPISELGVRLKTP